jgi:hypothetical protein
MLCTGGAFPIPIHTESQSSTPLSSSTTLNDDTSSSLTSSAFSLINTSTGSGSVGSSSIRVSFKYIDPSIARTEKHSLITFTTDRELNEACSDAIDSNESRLKILVIPETYPEYVMRSNAVPSSRERWNENTYPCNEENRYGMFNDTSRLLSTLLCV